MRGIRVAVQGCGHGKLQAIYERVEKSCKERNWDSVDLLIIGGDFQAVRNAADLNVMSVPAQYRKLGDFHEYYSGARVAPYLTVFVGGNHEASSYLWELYYGGWVAPGIYYMGAANVVRLGPLRIAGMSGIWSSSHYHLPHMERLPFSRADKKSFYHVREIDVRKLQQIRTQVDIGVSHDWPRAIEKYGDLNQLFKMKPHFERGSQDGSLGSPAAEYVMDRLRPRYWFSAHMHCKFLAIKSYETSTGAATQPVGDMSNDEEKLPEKDKATASPEEFAAGDNGTQTNLVKDLWAQLPASFMQPQQQSRNRPGQPVPETITNATVRFLALDKCLTGRHFLELCEIDPIPSEQANSGTQQPALPEPTSTPRLNLQYDPEWLAITRAFTPFLSIGDAEAQTPPDLGESHYLPLIEVEMKWVEENIVPKGKLDIPDNFTVTALVHVIGQPESTNEQPDEYTNPQTEAFCALAGVENLWAAREDKRKKRKRWGRSGSRGGHTKSRGRK